MFSIVTIFVITSSLSSYESIFISNFNKLYITVIGIKPANSNLRMTIFILASVCFLISAFTWWLSTPLQWKINGYAISLIKEISFFHGFTKSFTPFSFGAMSFLLFFFSIFFYCIKPLRKILFLVGICGIALSTYFLLKFVFLDATGINDIQYQQDQYNNMLKFSTKYLTHSNIDQANLIKLSFGNTIEKIAYLFHWISIGFYTNLLGSFLLIKVSRKFYQKHFGKIAIFSVILLLCLIAALSQNRIVSEMCLLKADKNLFSGSPEEAIDFYKKAQRLNPDLLLNQSYVYKLGFANYLIRKSDSSVHFFKGDNYASRFFEESLTEFNIAQEDPAIKKVSSREKVSLFTDAGLKDYGKGHNYTAASKFLNSKEIDSLQKQPYFFLSKLYLDIHRYDQHQTIANGLFFLTLCNERLSRADMYNMLGDSMYKSLDFTEARDMYNKSWRSFQLLRRVVNYNRMKGLQGL